MTRAAPGEVIGVCCLYSTYETGPPQEIRGPRPRVTPGRRLTCTGLGGSFFPDIGSYPARHSDRLSGKGPVTITADLFHPGGADGDGRGGLLTSRLYTAVLH